MVAEEVWVGDSHGRWGMVGGERIPPLGAKEEVVNNSPAGDGHARVVYAPVALTAQMSGRVPVNVSIAASCRETSLAVRYGLGSDRKKGAKFERREL